ncbi:hypothetical protein TCAL_09768, partial [Tigriopus californicus]
SDTFLNGLGGLFNLRLDHALVLGDNLTRDLGQSNGLVHTGLDRLGVSNTDVHIQRSNHRHIVLGFLSHLLAVLLTISLVSMTISGLAHGHHLNTGLLLEGHFDGLSGGVLVFLLIGVGAHLIVDLFNGLGAYCSGHIVAVFTI